MRQEPPNAETGRAGKEPRAYVERSAVARCCINSSLMLQIADQTEFRDNAHRVRSIEANLGQAGLLIEAADIADEMLSLLRRWAALDAGAWHPDRHASNKAELLAETNAAIAKATQP